MQDLSSLRNLIATSIPLMLPIVAASRGKICTALDISRIVLIDWSMEISLLPLSEWTIEIPSGYLYNPQQSVTLLFCHNIAAFKYETCDHTHKKLLQNAIHLFAFVERDQL